MTLEIRLKRRGMIVCETFTGNWVQFLIYRFKNRKWQIEIIS